MVNVKRWSDARLEKELDFARSFEIETPEAIAWRDLVFCEYQRRLSR